MDIAGHRWTSRHIAITIVSTTGQFGFPVMTEKQVVQEGGQPPAGARGVLAPLLFLLPPQAAKQAIR